jgi:hypothetical protein
MIPISRFSWVISIALAGARGRRNLLSRRLSNWTPTGPSLPSSWRSFMVEVGEIGTRRMLFTPNESDGASYSLSKAAEPIAAAGECGLNGFSINRLLSPELAPRAPESHLHPHSERIEIGQLRRRQRTDWGMHNKVCTTDTM